MIHYGKTTKVLKWFFQRHREEPAMGSTMNVMTGERGPNCTINDSAIETPQGLVEDMKDYDQDMNAAVYCNSRGCKDKRIIVSKNQQGAALGMGPVNELRHGTSFTFNVRQFRDKSSLRECFSPFHPSLFLKTPQISREDYIGGVEGREKVSTLDDLRRRASKLIGSKKILSLKHGEESSKKNESDQKMRGTSRKKEIVKWQSRDEKNKRWKILNRNKGKLSGNPGSEEDLLSCYCKLSRWDIRTRSSSSFSSSSGSSSSSSFRGVQSKREIQAAVNTVVSRCKGDHWITTDSEYVVLEI